jgi:hypothetical protein
VQRFQGADQERKGLPVEQFTFGGRNCLGQSAGAWENSSGDGAIRSSRGTFHGALERKESCDG